MKQLVLRRRTVVAQCKRDARTWENLRMYGKPLSQYVKTKPLVIIDDVQQNHDGRYFSPVFSTWFKPYFGDPAFQPEPVKLSTKQVWNDILEEASKFPGKKLDNIVAVICNAINQPESLRRQTVFALTYCIANTKAENESELDITHAIFTIQLHFIRHQLRNNVTYPKQYRALLQKIFLGCESYSRACQKRTLPKEHSAAIILLSKICYSEVAIASHIIELFLLSSLVKNDNYYPILPKYTYESDTLRSHLSISFAETRNRLVTQEKCHKRPLHASRSMTFFPEIITTEHKPLKRSVSMGLQPAERTAMLLPTGTTNVKEQRLARPEPCIFTLLRKGICCGRVKPYT